MLSNEILLKCLFLKSWNKWGRHSLINLGGTNFAFLLLLSIVSYISIYIMRILQRLRNKHLLIWICLAAIERIGMRLYSSLICYHILLSWYHMIDCNIPIIRMYAIIGFIIFVSSTEIFYYYFEDPNNYYHTADYRAQVGKKTLRNWLNSVLDLIQESRGEKTAQKDPSKGITSDSQVNSNFP